MREIFVFGSNLAGRHGAGSAKAALERYGAIYGQGRGLQGDSYGIPTKDHFLRVLPLHYIGAEIRFFCEFARQHPEMRFTVVKVGCGLAGYNEDDIKPFFREAPTNVTLPSGWAF